MMKNLFSSLCFVAGAAVSGTVVYLYMTDQEVKEKIDKAVSSVASAALEIKDGLEKCRFQKNRQAVSDLEKNRAWVDEQWEAIGI